MTLRLIMSILAGFFLLGGGGYASYAYFTKQKPQTYIICPTDTKQCKDGIGVGRISPSCEFALCPEERPEGTGGIKVLTGTPINGAYTGTIESIRENGGDYECSIAGDGAGVVYASQGELRGDFDPVVKPGVRSVPTHLILAKIATYVWTDMKGSGVTFVRGALGGDKEVGRILPFDDQAPLAFECKVWMRDAAQFTPPSTVSFKDVTPSVGSSTPQ